MDMVTKDKKKLIIKTPPKETHEAKEGYIALDKGYTIEIDRYNFILGRVISDENESENGYAKIETLGYFRGLKELLYGINRLNLKLGKCKTITGLKRKVNETIDIIESAKEIKISELEEKYIEFRESKRKGK